MMRSSIDEELDSVTEFQADEPMPWAQWHVGVGSELARTWQVRSIPTYVLIDGQGTVLAKGNVLNDAFLAQLRDVVGGGDQDGSADDTGEGATVEA